MRLRLSSLRIAIFASLTAIFAGNCPLTLAEAPPQKEGKPHLTSKPRLSAALSEPEIKVDVDFSGTRITLFAVSDEWDNPNVAFAVALVGPHRPYVVVRQKEKTKERFEFVSAPAVLAIATETTLREEGSNEAFIIAGVNPRYSAMPAPADMTNPNLAMWRKAFADLKAEDGLFSTHDTGLERLDGGLIRADIDLPAAAPPGEYDVRILLFQDGVLLAEAETPLTLSRKGVEHALFELSHDHPYFYGILAVLLGCMVGCIGALMGGRR
ncbi:TIGR02186 family protein [Hirschia litorea]|uniref:TIGR02186 family protein n=1 Tax=Hirschia litorea TaxID=1199156 RepID=A0ABW2IJ59_9PROT